MAAASDVFKTVIEEVLDKIQLPKSERERYLHFGREEGGKYELKNITFEDGFIDDLVASIKPYINIKKKLVIY
jgi:hypothetical protein